MYVVVVVVASRMLAGSVSAKTPTPTACTLRGRVCHMCVLNSQNILTHAACTHTNEQSHTLHASAPNVFEHTLEQIHSTKWHRRDAPTTDDGRLHWNFREPRVVVASRVLACADMFVRVYFITRNNCTRHTHTTNQRDADVRLGCELCTHTRRSTDKSALRALC